MDKPAIITVPILPFGMVNSHILIGTQGCVLIDTGIPGSERKIARTLQRHGRSLQDVSLIIVTHAHTDHAGSAARLRELTGAPILAHVADLDYYERRKPMTYCVAHWWGPLFLRSGVPTEPYMAFTPDILLHADETVDLRPYGIAGTARHTPGHTAGSISVELASGDAMVGDLVASGVLMGGIVRTGHAISPPFEDDPHTIGTELLEMVDAGMERFYLGHGGPLPADEVRRHALALQEQAPGTAYTMVTGGAGTSRLVRIAPRALP